MGPQRTPEPVPDEEPRRIYGDRRRLLFTMISNDFQTFLPDLLCFTMVSARFNPDSVQVQSGPNPDCPHVYNDFYQVKPRSHADLLCFTNGFFQNGSIFNPGSIHICCGLHHLCQLQSWSDPDVRWFTMISVRFNTCSIQVQSRSPS